LAARLAQGTEGLSVDLPPLDVREQVAEEAHRRVLAVHGPERAAVQCRSYARIGCALARRLTGRAYAVEEGRLSVKGDGFTLRTDHAWCVSDHSGRVEVVDLASRHWPALAIIAGAPGTIDAPPFVWCWSDGLPDGVTYAAESRGA
jgi:hypothetical protein